MLPMESALQDLTTLWQENKAMEPFLGEIINSNLNHNLNINGDSLDIFNLNAALVKIWAKVTPVALISQHPTWVFFLSFYLLNI